MSEATNNFCKLLIWNRLITLLKKEFSMQNNPSLSNNSMIAGWLKKLSMESKF